MMFWYTDNPISQAVAAAAEKIGHRTEHVQHFSEYTDKDAIDIFYGILRGTAAAMRIRTHEKRIFYYLDNGYFDAEYIDRQGYKDMGGKYRIVRGDMMEKYTGPVQVSEFKAGQIFMLIPPSPYTANYYDTTPEDWLIKWNAILTQNGYIVRIRDKKNTQPLMHDLTIMQGQGAGVLAFNSMSLMPAIRLGIPVYDTHGMFRNADQILKDDFAPHLMYAYDDVKSFYEPKSFTLKEIAEGKSGL